MPRCVGLSAEWDHMVSRVSPGGCPGPIVGRKEDAERPKGRILQREGTRIPLCDYRAGRSEGKNVGETGGRADWAGPRQPRASLPGWTVAYADRGLELSGGHQKLTHPRSPRPCETRGT